MGATVSLLAATAIPDPITPAGIILSAPAVITHGDIPWWQKTAVDLSKYFSWISISKAPLIKVKFTDNPYILKELRKDNNVIKNISIESVKGMLELMQVATENAYKLESETLLLYGEHDEIIPITSIVKFLNSLSLKPKEFTGIFYEQGYHMLLRDKQGVNVWEDIVSWILHPERISDNHNYEDENNMRNSNVKSGTKFRYTIYKK